MPVPPLAQESHDGSHSSKPNELQSGQAYDNLVEVSPEFSLELRKVGLRCQVSIRSFKLAQSLFYCRHINPRVLGCTLTL